MNAGKMIRDARGLAAISQTELARLSATSQATLSAYERGTKVPSAATLARVLAASGRRLASLPARPVVTVSAEELERRGRVLAAVIDLAERLPVRHSATLRFPPIGAEQE